MDDNCEFNQYHEYLYMPGDTKKEFPYVEEPYSVGFFEVKKCSHGIKLCSLTMNHRTCNSECKEFCSRYKHYLERKNHPKIPSYWNYETKQKEYGIPVDYNNWNT